LPSTHQDLPPDGRLRINLNRCIDGLFSRLAENARAFGEAQFIQESISQEGISIMLKYRAISCSILLIVCLVCPVSYTQTRTQSKSKQADQSELDALAASIAASHDDVVSAARNYRASLEKLLVYQEADVNTAVETFEKRKAMVEQQIVSTRELGEAERLLGAARDRVNKTRKEIRDADEMIAEYKRFDPKARAKEILAMRKIRERTPKGRVYYVRLLIIGEIAIYDYSGAISGQVIKYRQEVKHDSRKYK
jgi:hypothetical protein